MEKYYAIKSNLGYVMGLDVNGLLQVGGSLVKTMSEDEYYVENLYDFIINNTDYDVTLEEITLNVMEVEKCISQKS